MTHIILVSGKGGFWLMFSEKKVKIEIILYDYKTLNGETTTNFSSGKVLTFENYRVNCKIVKVPSSAGYTASVDIYGVSKQHLEQMTMIAWINGEVIPRGVKIYADDGKGYQILFEGGIMEAIPVYKEVPDVAIHIESSMLVYPNLMKAPPISLTNGASISLFCQQMCSAYGVACSFDESANQTWAGGTVVFGQDNLGDRLEALKSFGFDYNFGAGVYVFAKNANISRRWFFTPADYVGYPTFETFGICVETADVTSKINCGDVINIKGSDVAVACGDWQVNKIEYNLQPRKPDGEWSMKIHTTRYLVE